MNYFPGQVGNSRNVPSATLNTNHQVQQNSNQYFFESKYVSIDSESRNFLNYPNAAEFSVFLPQPLLNVASAKLIQHSFPSNYNCFDITNHNISMTFKFVKDGLYRSAIANIMNDGIFAALSNSIDIDHEFLVTIESGFYTPTQIAIELTNRFNYTVTLYINDYFNAHIEEYIDAKTEFANNGGYTRFNIVYDCVSQKMWFGNSADKFVLTNDSVTFYKDEIVDNSCLRRDYLKSFYNWGLPAGLGFTRCASTALSVEECFQQGQYSTNIDRFLNVPRFFYGDTAPGDDGYWLLPYQPDAIVYFLEAPLKINNMGPSYIFMEIAELNCIDECSPYALTQYTAHNNQTNGVCNSCFAKIPVTSTPISQFYDNASTSYFYSNPPLERLTKLSFRFRYSNGQLVQFGSFPFSFMLEFNILRPQQERSLSARDAYSLGQTQNFSSTFI